MYLEDYHQHLLLAARDYHDRGWTPIPIKYVDKLPVPPKGYGQWAQEQLDVDEIIRRFVALGDSLHAIAVLIGTTPYCWLDVDDKDSLKHLSRKSRQLPHYQTSRGRQYLVR